MANICDMLSDLTIDERSESNGTGIVFDDRMTEHRCLYDPNHIESPERFIYALKRCRTYNLLERCNTIPSRLATEEEIAILHKPKYIEAIRETENVANIEELETVASRYDSVYFHPKTYESALLSVGCTLELVSAVLNGKVRNGMAIVRPPGHHAMKEEACGFCFFNNVAIAAKHALQKFGLKKILIVDWDVHHGQATQQAFYDDPRVLYFSIHRYDNGNFWPFLRESNMDYVGDGNGQGYNINVPLNNTKAGNTDYLAIFNNILLPMAYEFQPELILVSAGYDAAIGCVEGEMEVTPSAYAHFLNLISGLTNGRICVILEGGYCLPSLAESVALTLRTLLGDPCPRIEPTSTIDENVCNTILDVITLQRTVWKSLRIQQTYLDKAEDPKKHIVNIVYSGTELAKPPPSYPTRECYPVQDADVRLAYETRLEQLIGSTDLSIPPHRTCLAYDPKMIDHENKINKRHPETGERLQRIYSVIQNSNLLSNCKILESRVATEAELELVHSKEYIEEMKRTTSMSHRELSQLQEKFVSVYICPATYESAIIACGNLLQMVDEVLSGNCRNGFALIRPPGHHAEESAACGFCIFNSIAIAAKYALKKYPIQKILIIDWDIHHGNGTQHIFYENNNVLYISLHRYDNGMFFPCEEEGDENACGKDDGEGFNINIPWNCEVGDGDYLAAFFHIILPVAYEFQPDLVLVSAGFDAAKNDPLGECFVSPACYGHMTKLLSGLANGKIILALEGGYNLHSLSASVSNCIGVLQGLSCSPLPEGLFPRDCAVQSIRNVVQAHEKYWKCLKFNKHVLEMKDYDVGEFDHRRTTSPVSIPNPEDERMENAPSTSLTPRQLRQAIQNAIFSELPTFFCVSPLEYCPHLELLQSLPSEGLNPHASCQVCNSTSENWVCLHCYQVYCGRFVNEHMLQHGSNMQHYLTLSYTDLSVWCYGCDSYVHNEVLLPVKQHVHIVKFGVAIG